jgi:hypothetical protein
MADQSIDKREQYVAFATHCLQLAKVAANRQSRDVLKEMAAEWLKLVRSCRLIYPGVGHSDAPLTAPKIRWRPETCM